MFPRPVDIETDGRVRFTREEVSEMRRRWEAGESVVSVARGLGADPATVSKIVRRKSRRFG